MGHRPPISKIARAKCTGGMAQAHSSEGGGQLWRAGKQGPAGPNQPVSSLGENRQISNRTRMIFGRAALNKVTLE
jgi:hypothetical protein